MMVGTRASLRNAQIIFILVKILLLNEKSNKSHPKKHSDQSFLMSQQHTSCVTQRLWQNIYFPIN